MTSHRARVFLNECRARRHSRANASFYWTLFGWAQAARRSVVREPVQGVLW